MVIMIIKFTTYKLLDIPQKKTHFKPTQFVVRNISVDKWKKKTLKIKKNHRIQRWWSIAFVDNENVLKLHA